MNAQKTPVLLACPENKLLSIKNVYMQYDGNYPVIVGTDDLQSDIIKAMSTGAPYVSDRLYQLKTQIWNEALTYLGISNINTQKKERMITDEVTRNQGGVVASRYSRLESRREACRKINDMFGLDIWCDYREDFQMLEERVDEKTSDNNGGEGGEGNE